MYDILIKDARIIDGLGGPSFHASIGINNGIISDIGQMPLTSARTILNAEGLAVSPGFIDIHAHSEFTLPADPRAMGKVLQGITTEVNGNCGLSAAPLYGAALERRKPDLAELGLEPGWNDLASYLSLLEKGGIALNFATLTGHGNLRGSVMGYDDRQPSAQELERMKGLLISSLEAGSFGLSSGLIYPPGCYAETGELIELGRIVRRYAGIYASHMRSEGDRLVEGVAEAIRIGEEAGIPVQISHLKTSGERNWHKISDVFRMIETSREKGNDITADRYPYTASSTDLDAVLPSWAYEGGNEVELSRLAHPDTRAKLDQDIIRQHPDPAYWSKVMVASVDSQKNRQFEGKTLADISKIVGKTPCETLFDILLEERLRVSAIFFSMSEDNLRKILSKPYVMIGSDASARADSGITRVGRPHPRTFGSFPRAISRYARDEKLMSIESMISKMTSLPARKLGMMDRGMIKPGLSADLVIFHPEKIADTADFAEPFQYPHGIIHVIVNGIPVVIEGRHTGRMAGKILRKTDLH